MENPQVAYWVPVASVVGDGFCVPYPVELVIMRRRKGLLGVCYQLIDANGNLYLQLDGTLKNFQKKGVMRDPAGFPILTMREKVFAARQRWTVHRGESSEERDVIFSTKRAKFLHMQTDFFVPQMKTQIEVFLPSNFSEEACNFRVVGTCASHSCKVYKGDILVAEVKQNFTRDSNSFCKGKDEMKLKVSPAIDYAFIFALVIIFIENDMLI